MNAVELLLHDVGESTSPRCLRVGGLFAYLLLLITSHCATTALLGQFFFKQQNKSRKNKPLATRFRKRECQRIRSSIAHKFRGLPVCARIFFRIHRPSKQRMHRPARWAETALPDKYIPYGHGTISHTLTAIPFAIIGGGGEPARARR